MSRQKMIAYVYGQKYSEMICTIIPSKKGLKLGFYKGAGLDDLKGYLKGPGRFRVTLKSNPKNRLNLMR